MRILFTSNPLVGHWLPMLPLVRAARAAGHEVVVAAGPDVVPDIERRGFAAWTIGADLATIQNGLRSRPRPAAESDTEQIVGNMMAMFIEPAVARANDLLERTVDWRPDIVVQEIYELAGNYVQADLHVLHGLGAHYPRFVDLAEMGLGYLRRRLGEPAWRIPIGDTPYVDPFPAILQPPDDRPFTDVLAVRPDAGEVPAGAVLPAHVVAMPHDRTVYLTLGTVFNGVREFETPLAGLRELAVNVVVTSGAGTDPSALQPLPPNVAVEQYLPQGLLLPHCAAVVCHAGAGTVIGALTHGVPLVCLPRGADQFGNAEQVSRIGAGITLLPEQASAEAISAATSKVLDDPAFRTAAGRIRAEIEQLPGPADVLGELVGRALAARESQFSWPG